MSARKTRLARALGRHLVRVMPASRSDWAAGMKAEIEAIDDPGAALVYALGCVRSGYERRLRSVPGALSALRWTLATGTVSFSALVFSVAWRAAETGSPDPAPQVLAGLGLAFLIAGLALLRLGPRALIGVAGAMLGVNTAGAVLASHARGVHAELYGALAIEGYVIWSALLLAGIVLQHAARSPRLAAVARSKGWDA